MTLLLILTSFIFPKHPFNYYCLSLTLVPITDQWRDELREFCVKAGVVPEVQAPPQHHPQQSVGLFAPPKRRTVYSGNHKFILSK